MPVMLDAEDRPIDPLFPRGYGLSDATTTSVPALPEDPRIPPGRNGADTVFQSGHVTAPWSIYVGDELAEVRLTTERQPSPGGAAAVTLRPGAVDANWAGGKRGTVRIGGRASDLRRLAAAGGTLEIRYRTDRAPAGAVTIGMGCGEHCRGDGRHHASLTPSSGAAWQTLEIPLACFAKAGADLSKIDTPLAIETGDAFRLSIAEAKFGEAPRRRGLPRQRDAGLAAQGWVGVSTAHLPGTE